MRRLGCWLYVAVTLLIVDSRSDSGLVAQTAGDSLIANLRDHAADTLLMETVSYLSDVYGPRLMGTPNYYRSVLYTRDRLAAWGLVTRLDTFDRDYRGWTAEDFSVRLTSPTVTPLTAHPLAFTTSTDGEREGELVFINTLLEAYALTGKLAGKIIMLHGLYRPVRSVDGPMSRRLNEEELRRAAANSDPNDIIIGYHSRISVPALFRLRQENKKRMADFFTFLEREGALAVVEPSDYPYKLLHADGNRAVPSFRFRTDIRPLTSFVLANEDFGRLLRLQQAGLKPTLSVSLAATYYEEPAYNVNLIAELPGTDPELADELVIIGAHLDSWHAGTGAVDNAANCGLLMEAMRLLRAVDAQPRRTVRLVLWGGEEQVFAGSDHYVRRRIGGKSATGTGKEYERISAYLNLDNGAGKIRGLYLMGNDGIRPYLAEYLQPYPASQTLTRQNANQTDHWLFDRYNIPAFQFIQDPLDYIAAIHHTNADVYEYVNPADQIYNAEVVAYLALQIANETHRMPRKPYQYTEPSTIGEDMFTLEGYRDAREVYLIGDFNNWDMYGLPMYSTDTGWEIRLDLPPGKHYYKFIVDGHWTADPATPPAELTRDGQGHGGLTVRYTD
jgi:hypothetical protein